MSLQAYLLLIAASAILALIPGPDMAYIVTRSVTQGPRAGVMAAFGVSVGCATHLLAAVTGLSALILASTTIFTTIKWVGAAYLFVLGMRVLIASRAAGCFTSNELKGRSLRTVFWQGFLSDVLNPKSALFHIALLPQFVEPGAWPVTLQLLLLGVTSTAVGLCVELLLVAGSARVTRGMRHHLETARWLKRAMGLLFVGLSVRMATDRI